MGGKTVTTVAARILGGYARVAKSIAALVLIIAAATAAGALIVFPLWYTASNAPAVYSAIVGGVFLAAAAYFLIARALKAGKRHGSTGEFLKAFFLPVLRVIGMAIFILAGAYLLIYLYAASLPAAAVPATVIYAGLIGYILYGRTRETGGGRRER